MTVLSTCWSVDTGERIKCRLKGRGDKGLSHRHTNKQLGKRFISILVLIVVLNVSGLVLLYTLGNRFWSFFTTISIICLAKRKKTLQRELNTKINDEL